MEIQDGNEDPRGYDTPVFAPTGGRGASIDGVYTVGGNVNEPPSPGTNSARCSFLHMLSQADCRWFPRQLDSSEHASD
jgi:hypothetical protein